MKKLSSSSGIGLTGFAFIVFLVLKLAEIGVVAKWSWWWVTAPLWMPLVFLPIGLFFYLVYKVAFEHKPQQREEQKKRMTFQERLEQKARER